MADILIKNGWIFDGRSESILSRADLLIENGVIKSVGNDISTKGVKQIINAEGKIVSPGFIDLNSQLDSLYKNNSVLNDLFLVKQGITTAIIGNLGESAINYLIPRDSAYSFLRLEREGANQKDEFLSKYYRSPLTINVGSFLGWETMRKWGVTNGLQLKAFFSASQHKIAGLSLEYHFNNQEQFLKDIKEIVPFLGKIGSSLMIYSPDVYISLEAVSLWGQISLENKVPFIINSLLLGKGENSETLLEETIKQNLLGAKIFFALWPYDYIPVNIISVINMLTDGVLNLKNEINTLAVSPIIGSQIPRELKGKTLKEIATNWSLDILETLQRLQKLWPTFNLEILLPYTVSSNWWASTFTYTNLQTKLINNGDSYVPNSLSGFVYFLTKFISKTSPELWPRYLAKITSQPALLAGLMNRGFLQKDYLADIVIINPDNLEAEGSYINPAIEGKGIETIIINGRLVWHKGRAWEKGVGKLLI